MSAPLGPFWFLVTAIAGWMCRHQQEVIAYLVEENRVLREQMSNRRLKLNDDQRRRLAAKAKKLGRKTLEQVATIGAPETLLRWHGKLIAKNNSPSVCKTLGRPSTDQEISALVVRMAQENRYWGYRRIQGVLANLGHDLAHNTIRNILKKHGIEPSPMRARKTTWREFLQRHWEQIVASDFFAMAPSKGTRLASLVILCFIKLSARRVDKVRTSSRTGGLSMIPIACKMTDNIERLCGGQCGLKAEDRSGTRRHHRNRHEPGIGNIENVVIVAFAAPDQKVSRLKRRHRRDRLLEYDDREAA